MLNAAVKKPFLLLITWLLSGLLFGQQKIPPTVKVTLNANKITLKEVFNRITSQTGYNINYGNNYINDKETIAIHVTGKPLQEVLVSLFQSRGLEFVIPPGDNAIIVRKSQANSQPATASVPVIETQTVEGRVIDTLNEGLAGTSVQLKGTRRSLATDDSGAFSLPGVPVPSVLIFKRVGYQPIELEWKGEAHIIVRLQEVVQRIEDVTVASTGYQQIKRSKTTGSYVVIDNNLLNRSISTNILDRLKGVTSGVLFDNNTGDNVGITIRGRSTIFGNATPLIVLDNYPYEGELSDINPNDIESITVLKDAVAAAIWGTRAGNGVIVIQSKRGAMGAKPVVSFSSNFTYGTKPDAFYRPQLSSAEYIEMQQYLFRSGAFGGLAPFQAVNPAVQIMMDRASGLISAQDSLARMNVLKQYDVRNDMDKYFNQSLFNQQYQVNVRGGTNNQSYYFSAGYDHNRPSDVTSMFERFSLKGNYSLSLLEKRLQINTDVFFTTSNSYEPSAVYVPGAPFERLADENGNALAIAGPTVTERERLKESYVDTAGNGLLLDWKYRPLDELRNEYARKKTKIDDKRINLTVSYKLLPGLTVSGNYQYNKAISDLDRWYDANSYYVRNQVNTFSQIDPSTGAVKYVFPKGNVLSNSRTDLEGNFLRFQANYEKVLAEKHSINAIAGYEIRSQDKETSREAKYGYNVATGTSVPMDFVTPFPYYYFPAQRSVIANLAGPLNWTADRNRSVYSSFSYVYDGKYVLTGSLRRDESNLFGVNANRKGVPLWSGGLGWIVSKAGFYNLEWLPYLKVSASYGFNGNVDNTMSAYLTILTTTGINNIYGNPTYIVYDPPNPSLSWERVRNINFLVDFASRDNRVTGTFEFYSKNGLDLIGRAPVAQQTGVASYRGNSANTNGRGVDVQLNTVNVKGPVRWETNLLFNYNQEKVKEYKLAVGGNQLVVTPTFNSDPLIGYPVRSVFSYRYAGLNASGRPVGLLNGNPSTDYSNIGSSTNRNDIRFHGSLVPQFFGSLRNTVSYRNLSFSFNIIYKMDYYFRRPSVDYSVLFNGGYLMPDFDKRWQKAGDELITNVPGIPAYSIAGNTLEDAFYQNSEVLVEKGDHIRLQDIQFAWNLTKFRPAKLPFRNLSLNLYASNLGIIWRANKRGLDPEALTIPLIKTYSLGLKAEF